MIFKATCSSNYIINESERIIPVRTEKRVGKRGRRSYLVEMGNLLFSGKNSSNRGRMGEGESRQQEQL